MRQDWEVSETAGVVFVGRRRLAGGRIDRGFALGIHGIDGANLYLAHKIQKFKLKTLKIQGKYWSFATGHTFAEQSNANWPPVLFGMDRVKLSHFSLNHDARMGLSRQGGRRGKGWGMSPCEQEGSLDSDSYRT